MKHAEFAEIVDLLEDRLSAQARKALEAHLQGCATCSENRNWAEQTLCLMRSSALVDAPEYVIQKAADLFAERKQRSFAEWVAAKLEFDSGLAPAQAGVRSSGASAARQWIYGTTSFRILLMLNQEKEGNALVGQVVPRNPDAEAQGVLVELLKNKKVVAARETNERGEFTLPPVAGKRFQLKIHGGPESILIEVQK